MSRVMNFLLITCATADHIKPFLWLRAQRSPLECEYWVPPAPVGSDQNLLRPPVLWRRWSIAPEAA